MEDPELYEVTLKVYARKVCDGLKNRPDQKHHILEAAALRYSANSSGAICSVGFKHWLMMAQFCDTRTLRRFDEQGIHATFWRDERVVKKLGEVKWAPVCKYIEGTQYAPKFLSQLVSFVSQQQSSQHEVGANPSSFASPIDQNDPQPSPSTPAATAWTTSRKRPRHDSPERSTQAPPSSRPQPSEIPAHCPPYDTSNSTHPPQSIPGNTTSPYSGDSGTKTYLYRTAEHLSTEHRTPSAMATPAYSQTNLPPTGAAYSPTEQAQELQLPTSQTGGPSQPPHAIALIAGPQSLPPTDPHGGRPGNTEDDRRRVIGGQFSKLDAVREVFKNSLLLHGLSQSIEWNEKLTRTPSLMGLKTGLGRVLRFSLGKEMPINDLNNTEELSKWHNEAKRMFPEKHVLFGVRMMIFIENDPLPPIF